MHVTGILAEYVTGFCASDLSDEAREAACRCVLDLLAATIPALDLPSVAGTRKAARRLFGAGAAPIWFTGERLNAIGAAWCNAAAASALDLDDGHRLARGHPGAAVIPAALATAAETDASAEDVILAIALGYEVGVRIAAARGFYGRSGTWCGYGAAAAAGRLRGVGTRELAHALAMAGMSAPNLLATNGGPRYPAPVANDLKEGIPWATVTGLAALDLAEAGLAGPEDLLDHAPHFDRDTLLASLGRTTAICESYFKPYAACRHIHAPVDALIATLNAHNVRPEAVETVDVHIYSGALTLPNRADVESLVGVQFSIPYCLGLAAYDGASAFLPLETSALGRPEIVAFARKVALHLDPALDARFPKETLARVVVTTGQGRFESAPTAPRGEASAPLSDAELEQKLRVATRKVIGGREQDAILAAVARLKGGEIAPLLDVLAGALGEAARRRRRAG